MDAGEDAESQVIEEDSEVSRRRYVVWSGNVAEGRW